MTSRKRAAVLQRIFARGDVPVEGGPIRADLYATDVRPDDQDPYLYKSTGGWRTPFAGRAEVSWFFTERRDYNLFA
ncbi:hypothetical protein [Streptomyces sp. NPDC054808]